MYFTPGRIRRNYEANRSRDVSPAMDSRGMLNGQGREALKGLSFGCSNVGKAGCESIAVYNALLALGRPRPLADIIRDMEKGGYLRMGGHLGAAPYFKPLLRRSGAESRVVLPGRLQRDADVRSLTPGAVFIMVIWNRRFLPNHGLHTFTAVYDPDSAGDWLVFNRFNSDREARRFQTLRDILLNGKHTGAYLVIYRIYPEEE